MALRHIRPLTRTQYTTVVKRLKEEERKPNQERINRIRQARRNAKKMGKVIYH